MIASLLSVKHRGRCIAVRYTWKSEASKTTNDVDWNFRWCRGDCNALPTPGTTNAAAFLDSVPKGQIWKNMHGENRFVWVRMHNGGRQ